LLLCPFTIWGIILWWHVNFFYFFYKGYNNSKICTWTFFSFNSSRLLLVLLNVAMLRLIFRSFYYKEDICSIYNSQPLSPFLRSWSSTTRWPIMCGISFSLLLSCTLVKYNVVSLFYSFSYYFSFSFSFHSYCIIFFCFSPIVLLFFFPKLYLSIILF
jgi:hypothetical protein